MDFLKAQLERIQRQFAGLNATQKMLAASLVAIIVITVIWWGKYAGEAEMAPLLDQSFTAGELGRIQARLDGKSIRYSVSGDKLLVPVDRRLEVLSDLTYLRLMPHSTQQGFDQIVKQMSPFDPESSRDKMWNHGKELLLGQIIGSFPDVVQADVLIDPTRSHQLEHAAEPSATVNITMREGADVSQQLVDAAADAVVGAQSGLSHANIKVVVNGRPRRVHNPNDDPLVNGADQLALEQQHAVALEDRVRNAFGDCPGLSITVTVKLNTTSVETEEHKFDAKGAIQKETRTSEESDESTGPVPTSSGEAGTVPNTGMSIPNASAPAAPSTTHKKDETQLQNFVPETHTISKTPAGEATTTGAMVRFPYSYFIRAYKQRNTTAKEPSYAEFKPLIAELLPNLQRQVASCVNVAPDKVVADTFSDYVPERAAVAAVASTTSGVSVIVGGHAKEIALGALALISLFMASMMVRKSTPSPVPAAASSSPSPSPPQVLLASEQLAGEAASGDALLDGMELNEDAIRAQQMVDQVSTMVRENPDAAAALVKRWLNRT